MKHSSLALLGLFLTPSLTLADEEPPLPPLTLLEKNKLAKGGKDLKPAIDIRVVGGDQVTQRSKYPFFVEWEDAKCGASLIHDDIALSAAHCENKNHPFATRVFVNGVTTEGGIFRTIERQVAHPLYKVNQNNDYDFMLLKLDSTALKDENDNDTGAETVTLNRDRSSPAAGDKLMAVGFGLTAEGGTATSQVLNDVEVKYVADSECENQYGTDTYAPDLMFCAGVEGGGKDTCQGDSGGPIMDDETGDQVGVVSFGIGCARANYNGVYARVSSVTEWIEDQICKLSAYPPEGCPTQPANGGIGVGNGEIKVSIKYDNYAKETAWSLVHDDSGEQLHFQPFHFDGANNGGSAWWSWGGLPAGKYSLLVGDEGRDGMCCDYGSGKIVLRDEKFGEDVWTLSNFGNFKRGSFTIANSGKVTFDEETTDYLNSWEASATPANYPQNNDQAWPGPKPAASGGLNINIKFDRFPGEVSYKLKRKNTNGNSNAWVTVDNFNGNDNGVHNDLISVQLDNMQAGWYELEIKDSGNDGICCNYRYGWIAATGFLKATRKSGLVWGNNGDFGSGTVVYLQVDGSGMFTQISDTSPM